jgi:PST family polysaccharide transporter
MAMVPIGLARLVEDLGLDAAIVQNQNLSEEQIASLGGLALIAGASLATLYLAMAQLLGSFYDEQKVVLLIRVLSLLFILDALQVVPRALLQKELRFGLLAIVNGVQITTSALILAFCAYLGLSYWALVLNHIISNLFVVLLLMVLRRHSLRWPREWRGLIHSIKFGGNMLIARIAWYGYSSADQLMLGRFAGADSLGAYNFSMTFARIPADEIGSLSGKVVPGVFSSIQRSASKLTRYLLMITEATSYLTVPATIGIALVAEDLIPLAIGPQWQAAIVPLQFLALYACAASVSSLWSHILIWTGNANLNMYLNILALIMLPPAFYFGSQHGPAGVAIAWVTIYPITLIPSFWFLGRILKLRFARFVYSLIPAAASTAAMSVAVFSFRHYVADDWHSITRFSTSIGIGIVVYLAILIFTFGRRAERIVRTIRRSI